VRSRREVLINHSRVISTKHQGKTASQAGPSKRYPSRRESRLRSDLPIRLTKRGVGRWNREEIRKGKKSRSSPMEGHQTANFLNLHTKVRPERSTGTGEKIYRGEGGKDWSRKGTPVVGVKIKNARIRGPPKTLSGGSWR